MAAARELEIKAEAIRRAEKFFAELDRVRAARDRLLWPSSRPSDDT
jgi:hypothetical protein